MHHRSRKVIGTAVMLAGIGFAFWLVFGSPHGWEGGMALVRIALGLASIGAISSGARLVVHGPADADGENAAP